MEATGALRRCIRSFEIDCIDASAVLERDLMQKPDL